MAIHSQILIFDLYYFKFTLVFIIIKCHSVFYMNVYHNSKISAFVILCV